MGLAEEEHLSPEEKLLRVIQNDGAVEQETSPEEKLAAAVLSPEDGREESQDVAQAPTGGGGSPLERRPTGEEVGHASRRDQSAGEGGSPLERRPTGEEVGRASRRDQSDEAEVTAAAEPAAQRPKLKVAGKTEAPNVAQAPALAAGAEGGTGEGGSPLERRPTGEEVGQATRPDHSGEAEVAAAAAPESSNPPAALGAALRAGHPIIESASPPRKSRGKAAGVGVVNTCLAVAILIVVLLAVVEIFATVGADGGTPPGTGPAPVVAAGGEAPVVTAGDDAGQPDSDSLQKILEAYRKTPILNWATGPGPGPDPGPRQPGLVAYLQKNVKFLGSSRTPDGVTEAILADSLKNKMSFLTAGQKLAIQISDKKDPEEVELVGIHADHVLFEYKGQQVMVQ